MCFYRYGLSKIAIPVRLISRDYTGRIVCDNLIRLKKTMITYSNFLFLGPFVSLPRYTQGVYPVREHNIKFELPDEVGNVGLISIIQEGFRGIDDGIDVEFKIRFNFDHYHQFRVVDSSTFGVTVLFSNLKPKTNNFTLTLTKSGRVPGHPEPNTAQNGGKGGVHFRQMILHYQLNLDPSSLNPPKGVYVESTDYPIHPLQMPPLGRYGYSDIDPIIHDPSEGDDERMTKSKRK